MHYFRGDLKKYLIFGLVIIFLIGFIQIILTKYIAVDTRDTTEKVSQKIKFILPSEGITPFSTSVPTISPQYKDIEKKLVDDLKNSSIVRISRNQVEAIATLSALTVIPENDFTGQVIAGRFVSWQGERMILENNNRKLNAQILPLAEVFIRQGNDLKVSYPFSILIKRPDFFPKLLKTGDLVLLIQAVKSDDTITNNGLVIFE